MGLLETEINELRQLRLEIRSGKISPEKAGLEIAVYNQVKERAKMMLQAMALSAKFGTVNYRRIIRTNLIGDDSAIDIDVDKIKCAISGKIMKRHECTEWLDENFIIGIAKK